MVGTLVRLPRLTGRKVRMTSSPHGPYVWGYTRATMAGTEGSDSRKVEQIPKTGLSSDWSLQLDFMKLELLVMTCQQ